MSDLTESAQAIETITRGSMSIGLAGAASSAVVFGAGWWARKYGYKLTGVILMGLAGLGFVSSIATPLLTRMLLRSQPAPLKAPL